MGLFNLVWFLFFGLATSIATLLASIFMALTIIGIPLAKSLFQFAKLSAFPFGKEVIRETELRGKENVSASRRLGGIIVNIIWFPIGLLYAISFLVISLFAFITIIGIPIGIVYVRMAKFILFPLGAKVVSTKQAYASAIANELNKRE
tara:strand:- start:415 stop:858 length:444 start_codon:yes stop_codon:yes gene_type:complete